LLSNPTLQPEDNRTATNANGSAGGEISAFFRGDKLGLLRGRRDSPRLL